VPDYISHVDLEGRLLFLNRSTQPFEQLRSLSLFDVLAETDRAAARQAMDRAIVTGEVQQYESGDVRPGSVARFINHVAPVRDNNGVIRSLALISTDMTAQLTGLQQLRESEARLGVALDATNIGIWSYDLQLQRAFTDERTREITSGSTELVPQTIRQFIDDSVHADDRAAVSEELARAFETGRYGPLENRVVWSRGGATRWISVAARVLHDDDGKPQQLVGTVQDVTDRRALEARLIEAQKLESIGRLAGGIAHDFNNMLMTISSNAELALLAASLDPDLRTHIEEIRLAGERSAALTRQLLAFARKQVVAPRLVELGDVVERLVALLARLLGEDIELEVDIAERCRLRIDPSQLEQVLLNLVTNARDAMPDGGALSLSARCVMLDERFCRPRQLQAGMYVAITVEDSGVGIAPATLEHIFEPFFSTNEVDNTGLGLATCHGIAKQNGGCIEVESALGEGSTFTVYLPRVATVDQLPAISEPALDSSSGGGMTLLVAEDERLVRRVVARTLRAAGYTVLEAEDGATALKLAAELEGELALLVTDVVMPGISGPQLVERLHAVRPDTRVVYMSGHVRRELSSDEANAPGVRFLQKPFMPQQLLEVIKELLAR
ncbi:MAG: response regulator, partial [Myxococcales bacterium]|nr:response regulator [Myxococcales bacterium]